MIQKQFGLTKYVFKPSWLGTLILIICVPLFIKLGLWQYNKAALKQEIQSNYEIAVSTDALKLPSQVDNFNAWQYKKIKIKGTYNTQYQILLDNQVENNKAGFHVLTPLKLADRNDYILINRGWVEGGAVHNNIPDIVTPSEPIEVVGQVSIPSKKIFTLESNAEKTVWNKVWQHMDMDRYQKSVPITVLPVVIKLDAKSNAGGFVRHWQIPASRIATNIGYAYQWFGFAFASIMIYLFTSIKKVSGNQ
ncbi:MAG: SURF1 family protein [Methylotenera sp.]|nr:SURF1 family protein [Methylotenera sp.]